MIFDHADIRYIRKRAVLCDDAFNGAFYYSQEIVNNIIPNIETDRNWVTVNYGVCADHSILFVHDNVNFEWTYEYTRRYKDVIYVVSLPDMVERAERFGKTILLPLSIDIGYVRTFKREKDKVTAFCGRQEWFRDIQFDSGVDYIGMMPRNCFLQEMASYKNVYGVCRVALEAKALDCKILPFHPRFPDVGLWELIDNKDAAKMLQERLDEIDGK